MKTKYSEKLKDPRWQKLRLKVFNRDKWTCQICKTKDRTLHVHHTIYKKEPWDAPIQSLVTLCEDCHEREKESYKESENSLLELLKAHSFLSADIDDLIYFIDSLMGDPLIMRNPREFGTFLSSLAIITDKQLIKESKKKLDKFWRNFEKQELEHTKRGQHEN